MSGAWLCYRRWGRLSSGVAETCATASCDGREPGAHWPGLQVRFALENVFEGVHGAGELGGIVGDGSGAAIRIADQARPAVGMDTSFSCIGRLHL